MDIINWTDPPVKINF